MDSMGLSSALEQQQGLNQRAVDMNNYINQSNNDNMNAYHQLLSGKKTADLHEDELHLGKIAMYGANGIEKVKEYRKKVESGEVLEGVKGSRIYQKLSGTGEFSLASSRPTLHLGQIKTPSGKSLTSTIGQDLVGDASDFEKEGKLLVSTEEAGGLEGLGKKIGIGMLEDYAPKPLTSKILGRSGQGESFMETAMRERTGAIIPTPSMAKGELGQKLLGQTTSTLEGLGKDVSSDIGAGVSDLKGVGSTLKTGLSKGMGVVGETLESVGKGVGGIVSAGMLGDDIYNQVKNKEFFTGDNAGEKVGNFANEMGATMDLVGLATGDPFLAMAGVGVGAVGSVVNEISGLIHGKTTEKTATDKDIAEGGLKPDKISMVAGTDLASLGKIAQGTSGQSSLKTIT